ncbi:MAG TPA: acyl-CoA dehydrogenase family protein [Caulobacteraceae bacterium]|jgi:alkylation response protein AidB-like acyl-CoA dehydrogenase|nr:acyl-CoA dehydrogenase family protein [Caulobacteraceae bacterium]
MDFNDTSEEAAYRAQVRAWLKANAPPPGASRGDPEDAAGMAGAKAWQRKKAEAGYAAITWPKDWGGGGGASWQSVIFGQEEAKLDTPGNPFAIGLGMCVPTIMTAGNDADKARFVKPAVLGEEIWCQLFSEPSGGSDAAAARTRAVMQGDEWVINGQKVWTSGAHYSDFGLLLARTDPDVPKHKGLTMFWIDMKAPGVEVRPIHQMSGASNFNEVYFTDLRIKDSQRVGPVGDGWRVAIITLMNERLSVGGGASGSSHGRVLRLASELSTLVGPAVKDAALREKIADWYVQAEGLKFTTYRTMTALSRGQTPGPENSIAKLVSASLTQDMANAALDLEDQFGIISDPKLAPLSAAFQAALMSAPGIRIAGGTDEIMRNIIAERVLGMPPDVRVDKDVAFKDIPSGR